MTIRPNIPICSDYEVTYDRSWEQISADCEGFRAMVVARRRSYATYADEWFLTSTAQVGRPLPAPYWLSLPGGMVRAHSCLIWQKSWTAQLPGVGTVDLDQFMQGEAAFRTFFGGFYH